MAVLYRPCQEHSYLRHPSPSTPIYIDTAIHIRDNEMPKKNEKKKKYNPSSWPESEPPFLQSGKGNPFRSTLFSNYSQQLVVIKEESRRRGGVGGSFSQFQSAISIYALYINHKQEAGTISLIY